MGAKGNCRLAWQSSNQAIYAIASVRIDGDGDGPCELIGMELVSEPWRDAVRFGYALLCESLAGTRSLNGAKVEITSFVGQPCDTTMIAAAYATFHAIADAIGVDLSHIFSFDTSCGHFSVSLPTSDE